jgi:signal peptidase I
MKKLISVFRSEILPLLLILLLVTAARSSLADHYYVPSGSMEYSLMPGDRVIVDKTAYGIRVPYTKFDLIATNEPVPGDVVIFDSPLDETLLIKRVVAVAGDQVSLTNGRLVVNGKTMEIPLQENVEEFTNHEALLNLQQGGGPDIEGIVVPTGKAVAVYYRRGKGFVWRKL